MQLLSGIELLSKCLGPGAVAAVLAVGALDPCSALQSSGDHRREFQGQAVQPTEVRSGQARSGELQSVQGHSGAIGYNVRMDFDVRPGSITPEKASPADGLSADSVALKLVPSPARQLLAVRPQPQPKELGGAFVSLLVLGLGLGLLLLWRRAWLRRRQRNRSSQGLELLLPAPGFRPRTPHERLHDPVYLQRMLEAERDNSVQRDYRDSQR